MVRPCTPPLALMAAKAALAPWCMAEPRSASGPLSAVDWAILIEPSCARTLPAPSQGSVAAIASSLRRARWVTGRPVACEVLERMGCFTGWSLEIRERCSQRGPSSGEDWHFFVFMTTIRLVVFP